MVRTSNESVPVTWPVINGGHHLVEIRSQFDRKAEAKLLAGASPLQRGAQYLTYGRYEKSPLTWKSRGCMKIMKVVSYYNFSQRGLQSNLQYNSGASPMNGFTSFFDHENMIMIPH